MNPNVCQLVKYYNLSPHFEGGYYRETYRSSGSFCIGTDQRNYCTSILYLLSFDQKSRLHRIKSDELWHYYSGNAPVSLVTIENKKLKITKLGHDMQDDQVIQALVPGGIWFGAFIDASSKDQYALLGCTVSPGFDVTDYEIPSQDDLKDLLDEASVDDLRILKYLCKSD